MKNISQTMGLNRGFHMYFKYLWLLLDFYVCEHACLNILVYTYNCTYICMSIYIYLHTCKMYEITGKLDVKFEKWETLYL